MAPNGLEAATNQYQGGLEDRCMSLANRAGTAVWERGSGYTDPHVRLYVASAHNNSREQLPGERPGPLRVYYRRPCGGIDITVKNVTLK